MQLGKPPKPIDFFHSRSRCIFAADPADHAKPSGEPRPRCFEITSARV